MPVKIHGKEYRTVAERLEEFHREYPQSDIKTEVISNVGGVVVMKATIHIKDGTYIGHASEKEDSTIINKTSALENAETSAVGRALAFAGYAGSEIASADEVASAISGQNKTTKPVSKPATKPVTQSSKPAITVQQAVSQKEGTVFNVMGVVSNVKERQTSTKKDITDYFIHDTDSSTKLVVTKWGKTHEGLNTNDVLIFKDVNISIYKGDLKYLAQSVEKIGK